jgi:shikimate kinase
MRIFIIGYMGSGKSTFGPKLARVMDFPFYDLDDLFEARYKISIHDFFRKYGEKYFREIEHALLSEYTDQDDFILATGGGTPCYHQNIDLMNQKGITIYLKVSEDTLLKRLKESPRKRPILQTFNNEGYEQEIMEHIRFRESYYNQAQLTLDGNSLKATDAANRIRKIALNLNDE